MELTTIILSVLGSIVVPLLIAFWTLKSSSKKHPKDLYLEDVNIAEKFEISLSSNQPMFVKDRMAQQLFETKKITYFEALYFYNFIDMEKWVAKYIDVRDELKLVRNSKGEILKIHLPHSRKKVIRFTLGYICFALLGLMPFLFINWYTEAYSTSLESRQYLYVFNLIIWPILFFIYALKFLIDGIKYNDAKRFVKKFEAEAIKV
jgi:hypothetical protein